MFVSVEEEEVSAEVLRVVVGREAVLTSALTGCLVSTDQEKYQDVSPHNPHSSPREFSFPPK